MSLRALIAVFGCLFSLTLLAAFGRAGDVVSEEEKADKATLRRLHWPDDVPALLRRIHEDRTSIPESAVIDRLIDQLGDTEFEKRQEVSKKLSALAPAALPKLRAAARHKDKEIARRAVECIDAILSRENAELTLAAMRVIARAAPEGALDGLLDLLTGISECEAQEEVWFALDAVARRQGKVPRGVADRTSDTDPTVRAACAYLLARRGDETQRVLARKLLRDAEPLVRLRAAQGLLAVKEKASIPVVIELLETAPLSMAWQSEELLRYAAGEGGAPDAVVGRDNGPGRKKCRAAWQSWWDKEQGRLDLAQRDNESRRPMLLIMCRDHEQPPRICLMGCDGRRRWDFEVPLRKGARSYSRLSNPCLAPGGQVFFVEEALHQNLLSRLDLNRDQVETVYQAKELSYRRLTTGDCLICEFGPVNRRRLVWLDQAGAVVRKQEVSKDEAANYLWPREVTLRNGNLLVNDTRLYRMVERTSDGKVLWVLPDREDVTQVRPCYLLVGLGFDAPRPKYFDLTSPPTALRALASKDSEVRYAAARFLFLSKECPADALPAILKATDVPDEYVRRQIKDVFWKLSQPEHFSLVLQAAESKSPYIRRSAMDLLRKFDEKPNQVVTALVKGLQDEDSGVRQEAALSIGVFHDKAASAVPHLIRLLKEDFPPEPNAVPIAFAASRSLSAIPSAKAQLLPLLAEAAKSKDEKLHAQVLEILVTMAFKQTAFKDKELPGQLMPAMKAALRGESGNQARAAVLSGLYVDTPIPEELITELVRVAADKSVATLQRVSALDDLWVQRGRARTAIPALEKLAQAADSDVMRAALRAIERIKSGK